MIFVIIFAIICIFGFSGHYFYTEYRKRKFAHGPADFYYGHIGFYFSTNTAYDFKTHDIFPFYVGKGKLYMDLERWQDPKYAGLFGEEELPKKFQEGYRLYLHKKFEEDVLGVDYAKD